MLLRPCVIIAVIAATLTIAAPLHAAGPPANSVTVTSPDHRAALVVAISPAGVPRWAVTWRGQPVLDPAPIGLHFVGQPATPWHIAHITRQSHDGMITGLIGKASTARDHYNEAVVTLSGGGPGGVAPRALIIRAYDDGVAYRWQFATPAAFALSAEDAGFGVPATARAWVMPVAGFTSSYEDYYRHGALDQAAPVGSLLTLPVLIARGAVWAGITEAALHDWAGLYVVRRDGRPGLTARLSPRVDRPDVAVIGGAGVHISPWRVVMLGDAPGALITSNLIALLNPRPDRRDWSWVKTGKTSFPWWNDYVWPGQAFTPGLNTATMDAYIDFDAAHGIAFHTLDGFDGQAWYPGPIIPDGTPQDLTRARPAIDMPEIIARARARGVGLRLWCHWVPLHAGLDAALTQWEKWGITGLMVDFMNRDDQEMVAFYDEVARRAADHHLTVVYHGAFKPTGESRTWPNVLTREAVRGTEYDKFPDNPGSTPEHEVTTPFTRMLAGGMDIHEGGFDAVAPAAFHNRNSAPQVIGTRARALATYVVQENALAMVADTPANYIGATGFDFVAHTPTSWDETRVLAADVGHYIVVARRKGAQWWVGAMTDAQPRDIAVRLPMVQRGGWTLDGFADGPGGQSARAVSARLDPDTPLVLHLVAAGGYAGHLTPPVPVRRR